jgi:hypothetical protein
MPVVSEPRVRLAVASDEQLLRHFRCSTGVWYEDSVERFVTERALARALDARLDFRLLLLETDAEGLLAVGAHHWRAYDVGGATVDGTYLVVAAIALAFQGARLGSDERLSDFVMNALLSDARGRGRGDLVTVLVARENARSIALCQRFGIDAELPSPNPAYVHLVGWRGAPARG